MDHGARFLVSLYATNRVAFNTPQTFINVARQFAAPRTLSAFHPLRTLARAGADLWRLWQRRAGEIEQGQVIEAHSTVGRVGLDGATAGRRFSPSHSALSC